MSQDSVSRASGSVSDQASAYYSAKTSPCAEPTLRQITVDCASNQTLTRDMSRSDSRIEEEGSASNYRCARCATARIRWSDWRCRDLLSAIWKAILNAFESSPDESKWCCGSNVTETISLPLPSTGTGRLGNYPARATLFAFAFDRDDAL